MPGLVTVTVNDSAFRSYLQQLQSHLNDMTQPMSEIGATLEHAIRQRFETLSDPSGKRWAPWSLAYEAAYPYAGAPAAEAMGGAAHGRLLDRYGDMLTSLNWEADASSARVGFGQHYAVYHEWGTRKMPRRGLIFSDPDTGQLSQEDEANVLEILEHWLTEPNP